MTCCCRMLYMYPSYLPDDDSSCVNIISFGASRLQPLRQTSPCLFLASGLLRWLGGGVAAARAECRRSQVV